MTTPIHSIDPVIREDVVDLAKLVSFGIGPQAWVTFQHSIVWLRSVTASISYHHGGKLLKGVGRMVIAAGISRPFPSQSPMRRRPVKCSG